VPLQGKRSLFLGAVGAGARMKLVVNMVMGSMMGEDGSSYYCGLMI
jgi:3-hydroxyisobutyrate dehydrogenase-like beta-hydroxyacid dehydrogenase